jgi:hypothetical protein
VTKKRDWRAVRERAMAARLDAYRGSPRDRFHADLRATAVTWNPVLVEKCLRRHAAVVTEILSEP